MRLFMDKFGLYYKSTSPFSPDDLEKPIPPADWMRVMEPNRVYHEHEIERLINGQR